ncbi:penicillin-binding protein 1A [Noviherbaspirillum humi]|uniref:peptidoglycan glycosyltransferase n=1 Tax=Noviherbaspirillum humi TaxID=1688639 RepID=A0A239C270_9BURK|nr:transglycosylase domain-containing protein [Noviherbaspirillum humi]SNS13473.1 penicillin-binding protein 1A [Noviherbaspirillum humi]
MSRKNTKQRASSTSSAQKRRRGPFATTFVYLMRAIALCMVLGLGAVIAAGAYVYKLIPETPEIEDLLEARTAEPSLLFSASGKQIAVFSQGQQERVTLAQVSPYVVQALIATEDHRFYEHQGIDLTRTASAIYRTLRGDTQGGSTITQQLVRNMFPDEIGRAKTIDRKIKEIITALKIEQAYTKNEILETYLNTVPFLYNVVGIEMAARTYYDKPAANLNVLESATLIGMLKGTAYYNPILNPERARKRRNVVLGQMVKHHILTRSEVKSMRDEPLHVRLTRQPDPLGTAPHFAAYVRRWLIDWADEHDYNLYTDGLIIHSTIDDRLQEAAQEAVARQSRVLQNIADVEWAQKSSRAASQNPAAYAALRKKVEPFRHFWNENDGLLNAFLRETPEFRRAVAAGQRDTTVLAKLKADADFMARLRAMKTRLEAGFMAMDPNNGEVKAWVGSRDFEVDQFDHVAQAERQPGSTFKPIVYGAALEMGMKPDKTYPDTAVQIALNDGTYWRPTDMSGVSGRRMSLREGLMYSKNTITAQVMRDVGIPNIVNLARAVGVKQSRLDPVPSLSLGTSPVTLLEMVSSYATIAQAGEYRKPVTIKRITDRAGRVLAEFGSEPQRAMSEDTAVELIDMMRGAVKKGTGTFIKTQFNIGADIAGKTGTTQNNTDGWFILMHPELVAGAWVGFNDSRVTMRSDYWGQGGHNALLLVGDFYKQILKSELIDTKLQFPKPKRRAPLIVKAPEYDALQPGLPDDALPPGYGVMTRDDGQTILLTPGGSRVVESQRERLDEIGRMAVGGERGAGENASGGGAPGGAAASSASGPSGASGASASPGSHASPSPPRDEIPITIDPARGRTPSQADVNLW